MLLVLYEKAQIGNWKACDGGVPVTTTEMQHMGVVTAGEHEKHPSYEKEGDDSITDVLLEEHEEGKLKGSGDVHYALMDSE